MSLKDTISFYNLLLIISFKVYNQMSASVLSVIDKKQNESTSRTLLKNIKYKSHRVLKPVFNHNSIIFDHKQIAEQLLEQCTTITNMIQNYNQKLKQERVFEPKKNIRQELITLHQIISQKDDLIKELNTQIRQLKAAKYKSDHKTVLPANSESQMFQLTQQLKLQRIQLKQVFQIHMTKFKNFNLLFANIMKLEAVYKQKCKDSNKQMTYEVFKEKYKEIKMQESIKLKIKRQRFSFLKRKTQAYNESSELMTKNESNKSMKDLQDKKKITTVAIKNAKKMHQIDTADLKAKLQFLRDENALLDQKIKQKQNQRDILEARFNFDMQVRLKSKIKEKEFKFKLHI